MTVACFMGTGNFLTRYSNGQTISAQVDHPSRGVLPRVVCLSVIMNS